MYQQGSSAYTTYVFRCASSYEATLERWKRVMKEAINKAVATGKLLKCADCHSNTTDYALKSDAVDKLQSWLGE